MDLFYIFALVYTIFNKTFNYSFDERADVAYGQV